MATAVGALGQTQRFMLPRATWLTLGLVLAVTIAPLASIHLVGWAPGTEVLFAVVVAGALLAFWLSRTRLRTRWTIAIGAVLDLVVAYVIASEAFPGPIDGLRNFGALFGETVEWVQLRQAGDFRAAQPVAGAVGESAQLLQDLYFRLETWFQSAFALQVSRDNVVFLFWMSMAAWAMGYFTAWAAFRQRNPLLALLPGTLAIGINITYIGPDWVPFVVFLFAGLALTVHIRMTTLQRKWAATGTDYSSDLSWNVLATSTLVIALVVLLSVGLPRAAGNPVAEAFWTYLGDGWGNVETGIQRLFGGVSNPSGSALAGRETLGLSGPQPLRPQGTLIIQSTAPSYWRGQTFNVYTGQGWRSSFRELAERGPSVPVAERIDLRSRIASRTNVEILDAGSAVLYAPGDAVRLNRRYLVQVVDRDSPISDFASIRATRRVGQRLVYSVDSTFAGATAPELRSAPTEYPEWLQAYTDLPEIPERIQRLAQRLAQAGDTAFDRVQAVEFFMRRFPFASDIPPLPSDRDASDFCLFDLRRGHPSLIASTAAVLVRSMGYPSRIATGFTRGTFDPQSERYIVNPEDSHAWIEVYFPTYGWVAFEPSGFRVPVVRGGAGGLTGLNDASRLAELTDVTSFLDDLDEFDDDIDFSPVLPDEGLGPPGILDNLSGAVVVIGAVLGVIAAVFFAIMAVAFARDRLQEPRESVQRTYQRMVRYARRAGYNTDQSLTPWELARQLSGELFSGDTGSAATSVKVRLRPPESVASTYLRATYSRHAITQMEKRTVEQAWKQIRRRLLRRLLRLPRRVGSSAAPGSG